MITQKLFTAPTSPQQVYNTKIQNTMLITHHHIVDTNKKQVVDITDNSNFKNSFNEIDLTQNYIVGTSTKRFTLTLGPFNGWSTNQDLEKTVTLFSDKPFEIINRSTKNSLQGERTHNLILQVKAPVVNKSYSNTLTIIYTVKQLFGIYEYNFSLKDFKVLSKVDYKKKPQKGQKRKQVKNTEFTQKEVPEKKQKVQEYQKDTKIPVLEENNFEFVSFADFLKEVAPKTIHPESFNTDIYFNFAEDEKLKNEVGLCELFPLKQELDELFK